MHLEGTRTFPSLILMWVFFYEDPQAGWATRTVILPVSAEIWMEKIRCIFNYKINRVYAFHALNAG